MKLHLGYCLGSTRFFVYCLWFVTAIVLALPSDVRAALKDQLTDEHGAPVPIQEVLKRERKRGPIVMAIPLAFVFGMEGKRPYCSPQIRADNASNAVIQELMVGIEFFTTRGTSAGSSLTRYSNIKVQAQDTHYFYQLTVETCDGLEGEVTVERCIYANGDDCKSDVRAVHFGVIPLRMKARANPEK